jgi:hypothetical protein
MIRPPTQPLSVSGALAMSVVRILSFNQIDR